MIARRTLHTPYEIHHDSPTTSFLSNMCECMPGEWLNSDSCILTQRDIEYSTVQSTTTDLLDKTSSLWLEGDLGQCELYETECRNQQIEGLAGQLCIALCCVAPLYPCCTSVNIEKLHVSSERRDVKHVARLQRKVRCRTNAFLLISRGENL